MTWEIDLSRRHAICQTGVGRGRVNCFVRWLIKRVQLGPPSRKHAMHTHNTHIPTTSTQRCSPHSITHALLIHRNHARGPMRMLYYEKQEGKCPTTKTFPEYHPDMLSVLNFCALLLPGSLLALLVTGSTANSTSLAEVRRIQGAASTLFFSSTDLMCFTDRMGHTDSRRRSSEL